MLKAKSIVNLLLECLFGNTYNGGHSQHGNIPCNDVAPAKQGHEYTILEENYDHLPHSINNKVDTLSFGGWELILEGLSIQPLR